MKGFDPQFRDLPDYIVKITKEIWEDRGVATLNRYYAEDIPVRTPMGVSRGNAGVIAATLATLAEFPDRQLYADDVIWSGDEEAGFLSSHRIVSTMTHTGPGAFGPPTGRRAVVRVIADCAAKDNVIYDEWLVRDYGGLVRQLGHEPSDWALRLIAAEGGPETAARPFTPATDLAPVYGGTGNDSPWGEAYADSLTRIMSADLAHVLTDWDRAAIGHYAGAREEIGRDGIARVWTELRSSFPSATFTIHHRIGMEGGQMPPRAALRWSLDGRHDGWGRFGRPTGAPVHVMGLAHAEWGPRGLRRECALIDDVAIWKQIHLHTGATQ